MLESSDSSESSDWKILTSTAGLSSFALGRNQEVICQWFNSLYWEKLSNAYDIAIVVVYKVSVTLLGVLPTKFICHDRIVTLRL